jgi:membrane protein required for colicin V production
LLIALAAGLIYGLFRGFVGQLFSIAGLVFGLVGAAFMYEPFANTLDDFMSSRTGAEILAFLLIFAVIVLVVALISRAVKRFLTFSNLGWADRLAGGVFGAAKVFLAEIILVSSLAAVAPDLAVLDDSVLVPTVLEAGQAGSSLLPDKVAAKVDEVLDRISSGDEDEQKNDRKEEL